MTTNSYRYLLLCSVIPFALSACSGGGSLPSVAAPAVVVAPPAGVAGAENGGTGTPGGPLAAFTTITTFNPTPHEGLETIRISAGVSIAPEANPILVLTRTTTGFDMALSEGAARFDTRTGSTNILGASQYTTCIDTCPAATATRVNTTFNSGGAVTLAYSTYGVWTVTPAGGISRVGAFATGVVTTPAQMPTTGAGTYTGGAAGYVITTTSASNISFVGDATFNLDFAARIMTGAVANITTRNLATSATGKLGTFQFANGSIDLNTTHFSGSAAAVPDVAAVIDLTGAVGKVDGVFYGPAAAEAAGTFALTKAGASVIGSFSVKR